MSRNYPRRLRLILFVLAMNAFISLICIQPTHAATNFNATIVQCNGDIIPQFTNSPSWYPQGSTNTYSNYGQFAIQKDLFQGQTQLNFAGELFAESAAAGVNAPDVFNSVQYKGCDGSLQYATTQKGAINVSWDLSKRLILGNATLNSCKVSAFFNPNYAGNQVRYDFWSTSRVSSPIHYSFPDGDHLRWLAWMGKDISQNSSGWLDLGSISLPAGSDGLVVTLNDESTDTAAFVSAGAMQFACSYSF